MRRLSDELKTLRKTLQERDELLDALEAVLEALTEDKDSTIAERIASAAVAKVRGAFTKTPR